MLLRLLKFSLWSKAGGQLQAGLTKRRAAERQIFLEAV